MQYILANSYFLRTFYSDFVLTLQYIMYHFFTLLMSSLIISFLKGDTSFYYNGFIVPINLNIFNYIEICLFVFVVLLKPDATTPWTFAFANQMQARVVFAIEILHDAFTSETLVSFTSAISSANWCVINGTAVF